MLYKNIPQPGIEQPSAPDTSHNRRGAYAAMKDLEERFFEVGICTEQVWEFIQAEHCVDSRSQCSAQQWARIAAELQSIRRDTAHFEIFVDSIPDTYFRIHVFASDPSVAIGRPHDIKKHHIASEWGDFQETANASDCEIKVVQGKTTTYYKPANRPVPVQNPNISLLTNVRGEVLSPWGDVIERRGVQIC